MGYDPFAHGPYPVGVRTGQAIDTDRDGRRLPVEVWYPEGASGAYPLVLYSHASFGHKRQSSFLCTHLASHGYVVVAADHSGNSAVDFTERAARIAAGEVRPRSPEEADAFLRQIIADRVPDLRFLLDQVLAGAAGEVSRLIDERRIGLAGWSFGGWAGARGELASAAGDHSRHAHTRLEA